MQIIKLHHASRVSQEEVKVWGSREVRKGTLECLGFSMDVRINILK